MLLVSPLTGALPSQPLPSFVEEPAEDGTDVRTARRIQVSRNLSSEFIILSKEEYVILRTSLRSPFSAAYAAPASYATRKHCDVLPSSTVQKPAGFIVQIRSC